MLAIHYNTSVDSFVVNKDIPGNKNFKWKCTGKCKLIKKGMNIKKKSKKNK